MVSSALSSGLQPEVDRYGASHRHPVNRALHAAGIPFLLTSALGLLSHVPLTGTRRRPDAAALALAGASLWYLRRDARLGLLTAGGWAACYALGRRLSPGLLTALFGTGIAAHLVGHFGFEGKPPAVLSDPAAVLEAPAWLLCQAARLMHSASPRPAHRQPGRREH